MGAHNHNYRLLKIHRCYTVEEVAKLLTVHRNTVRRWFAEGLCTIDQRRPVLVRGDALRIFLEDRRRKGKRPCKPGEFYCLRCRAPKRPAGSTAQYHAFTFDRGTLIGECPDCSARLNRRVSLARMGAAIGDLQVAFPQADDHIDESLDAIVNSDFDRVSRPYA